MAGRNGLLVAIARRREGPVPIRVERTVDPDWAGDPLAAAAPLDQAELVLFVCGEARAAQVPRRPPGR